jgi:anti-sigma28 factor (negative regulator of flagellin synthesis)
MDTRKRTQERPGAPERPPSERDGGDERRAALLRSLKEKIRAGTYKADIKEIALQLTYALDPKL